MDSYGNPLAWNGFSGFANNLAGTPYITCPLHNQDTIINMPTDPTNPDEWGNGDVIYPDDSNNGFNFGNSGNDYSGGNSYGDYNGNGDVFF